MMARLFVRLEFQRQVHASLYERFGVANGGSTAVAVVEANQVDPRRSAAQVMLVVTSREKANSVHCAAYPIV